MWQTSDNFTYSFNILFYFFYFHTIIHKSIYQDWHYTQLMPFFNNFLKLVSTRASNDPGSLFRTLFASFNNSVSRCFSSSISAFGVPSLFSLMETTWSKISMASSNLWQMIEINVRYLRVKQKILLCVY